MTCTRRRKRNSPYATMAMPNTESKNGSSISGDNPESVRNTTGCRLDGTRRVMAKLTGTSANASSPKTAA